MALANKIQSNFKSDQFTIELQWNRLSTSVTLLVIEFSLAKKFKEKNNAL